MGFKDLMKLGKKDNLILLILTIWLLAGYTIFDLFDVPFTEFLGILVFIPLIVVCFIIFLLVLLFRKDLKEISLKKVFLYILIALGIMVVFQVLGALLFGTFLALSVLGIISYIFITAFFFIYNSYEYGVTIDDKFLKLSKGPQVFLRLIEFIGGIILTIFIILADLAIIQAIEPYIDPILQSYLNGIAVVLFLAVGVFGFLALILLATNKFNAWLGVFFTWAGIYSLYLSGTILIYVLSGTSSPPSAPVRIALLVFDILLILFTISQFIGERGKIISKKLPFRSDTVVIWLIFSKACYEFVNALEIPTLITVRVSIPFLLFIVLIFILGFYGIIKYQRSK